MFRQYLQQNSNFTDQNLSHYQFVYHKLYVDCLGIVPSSHGVCWKIKHMGLTWINWFIAISLSSEHSPFFEYCRYSERFTIFTGSFPGVRQIFSSFLCPDNYMVHLASYLMWNKLYCPSQCNITQRPAQHDALHTLHTPCHHSDSVHVCTLAADRIQTAASFYWKWLTVVLFWY
jgi:hypothetical protein